MHVKHIVNIYLLRNICVIYTLCDRWQTRRETRRELTFSNDVIYIFILCDINDLHFDHNFVVCDRWRTRRETPR